MFCFEKRKKNSFSAQDLSLALFLFFLSRRPNSLLPAQSVSLASLSRGRCLVGPACQGVPFLVPSRDSPPSPGAARAGAAFLACTPRPLAAPYLRCRGPRLGSPRTRSRHLANLSPKSPPPLELWNSEPPPLISRSVAFSST